MQLSDLKLHPVPEGGNVIKDINGSNDKLEHKWSVTVSILNLLELMERNSPILKKYTLN